MPSWIYAGWIPLVRTAAIGVLAYVTLVVMLRISGKRTLSKMNAFDLVVTVALGSTLASIMTSKLPLAEGATAFATLIGLQYAVAWLSARSDRIAHFVKARPTILAYRGELFREVLRRERVVEAEVVAVLRSRGATSLDEVEAVVLETDGKFSVVTGRSSGAPAPTLPRRTSQPVDVLS
jgi:uncharacterized membrane protein YcaP (DUF421 family)